MKRKRILVEMICLLILTGASVSDSQTADQALPNETSGAPISGSQGKLPEGYALLADFESAGRESEMYDIHLVDGCLYYRAYRWDAERQANVPEVYIQEQGKEARLLLRAGQENEKEQLTNFAVGKEGSLYLLYRMGESDEDAAYRLKRRDQKLQEIYSADITADMKEALELHGEGGIWEMEAGVNGWLYAITWKGTLLFWDENGEYQGSFALKAGRAEDCGLVNAGSGGVYAYFIVSDPEEGQSVKLYDPLLADLRSASEPIVSAAGTPDALHVFGGGEDGLYLADKNRLWKIDLTDGTLSSLFSWEEMSLKAGYVKQISRKEDGGFLLYILDALEGENYWTQLNPVPVSQIPEKIELVLGVAGEYYFHDSLTAKLDQVVLSYNRTHPACHITIKEYGENGVRDFQLELLRGEGPDILLERRTFFDMENLLQKGAVEDLAPYLAKSEEITEEEIVPGILALIQKEGRIARIPLSFSVKVMIVPADTPEVMTPEELTTLILSNEQGYRDWKIWPRSFLIEILFGAEMDRFVDEENHSCSFDSEEFVRLLETFAALSDREAIPDAKERAELFESGRLNVIVEDLNCMGEYFFIRSNFSGLGRIAGFPNSKRELRYPVQLCDWLGINSASKHKEEAWSFIEFCLLNTSCCDVINDRFAVTEDVFERQTRYEKTTYCPIQRNFDYSDKILEWGHSVHDTGGDGLFARDSRASVPL